MALHCQQQFFKGRGAAHACWRNHSRGRTGTLLKQRDRSPIEASYSSKGISSDDDERPSSSGRPPSQLFGDRHILAWRPELVLYAPIGVALATFRSALWMLGIALDQPWFRSQAVVEAYLRLLGVTVTWRGVDHVPAGRHILVSNHVSVGDLMILFSHPALPRRYTHLITSALPPQVTQCKNLPVVLRHASPAVYDELASSCDPSPVHLFPEGGLTNGAGLLRFSRGFTRIMQQPTPQQQQQELQEHKLVQVGAAQEEAQRGGGFTHAAASSALPVVPVALRVRGIAGVCSHTLASSFLANLFWFSFSPATTFEATVLPPVTPLPGEARGAFVNRVQAAIAAELGVEVFDMTIQQKKRLVQQAAGTAGKRR